MELNKMAHQVSRCYCFLCGAPRAAWLISKKGKPFWKCSACYATIFINSALALNAIKNIQSEILGNKEKFENILRQTIAFSMQEINEGRIENVGTRAVEQPADSGAKPAGVAGQDESMES